eukprot:TRINITY_DN25462_c0_g1_i1.p1 TRINITY_DN25462_c0_g1~~TRINITY_DN25462_c0_g1_i1.p1  ORF type:complete len:171 (+),score=37.91 TRINITY_DN25462_c0_g1_i1:106-618(+)
MESAIPLGSLGFDPLYLLTQIATIQATYYVCAGAALHVCGACFGVEASLDGVFITTEGLARGATLWGAQYLWYIYSSLACTSVGTGYAIAVVAERSKKCFDHTLTQYVLHLVICCCAQRALPKTATFYFFHGASALVMYFVARRVCLRREMAEVTTAASRSQSRSHSVSP